MRLCLLAVVMCLAFVARAATVDGPSLQASLKPYFVRVGWRFFDKRYETIPAAAFTSDFLPSYVQYLKERGITGVSAGFTERQYAEMEKVQLDFWLSKTLHYSAQPACALLLTDPSFKDAYNGLPAAWFLVNLDGAWYVQHPTQMTLVPLEKFPYRQTISAVHF